MKSRDPAPALARGLDLLARLGRDGARTLEQLAGDTGWPKSSLLRLLESLERFGAVRRDPATRRFHARLVFAPVPGGGPSLAEAGRAPLHALAATTGQTAELHAWDGRNPVMIDRFEPEGAEVRVVARIGFVRGLDELDALTLLALAFGLPAREWPTVPSWEWRGGRRAPVSPAGRRDRAARVRAAGFARDADFNSNGVRRFAAPVLRRERLLGIVACAQTWSPRAESVAGALERAVAEAAGAIRTALGPGLQAAA